MLSFDGSVRTMCAEQNKCRARIRRHLRLTGVLALMGFACAVLADRSLLLFGLVLIGLFIAGLVVVAGSLVRAILYRHEGWRSAGALALVALLSVVLLPTSVRAGVFAAIYDTPFDPSSYFDAERERRLTALAEDLLKKEREKREAEHAGTTPNRREAVAPDSSLAELGFRHAQVDVEQGIVRLSTYRVRRWHHYIYARDGLRHPDAMPSTLTDSDIDWRELRAIVDNGGEDTAETRYENAFVPSLAYALITDHLPEGMASELHVSSRASAVPPEVREAVLKSLNHQRTRTGLLQRPEVRLESSEGEWTLHLGTRRVSESFRATRLLRDLVREGAVTLADESGHLELESNLTPDQIRRVQWARTCVLEHALGNFVRKRFYPFREQLSPTWYVSVGIEH